MQSNSVSFVTMIVTLILVKNYSKSQISSPTEGGTSGFSEGRRGRLKKPRVDMAFVRRIYRLLGVMVPGPASLEVGCLGAVAGLLVARTSLDVVMLNVTTTIEHAIVGRNKAGFTLGILRFARLCVPLAAVNSLLKYFQAELALRFRQRLTEHVLGKYMSGFTYYAVSNLDNRISNPDQV
ncbi:unnamed protein product, partial [Choristocarpus tenellus]